MKKFTLLIATTLFISSCGMQTPKSTEISSESSKYPSIALSKAQIKDVNFTTGNLDFDNFIKGEADSENKKFYEAMGGVDKAIEFLMKSNSSEIASTLKKFGMGFRDVNTELSAQNVLNCDKYFPASDHNMWWRIGGNQVIHIDDYGRPNDTYITLPPITSGARQLACQATVGQWGGSDYQGGHLIAATLGGWGGRANLVPQYFQFNNGAWQTVENAVRRCANQPQQSVTYRVAASYPWFSSSVVPNFLYTSLSRAGALVTAYGSFENNAYGGAVNDLSAQSFSLDSRTLVCN